MAAACCAYVGCTASWLAAVSRRSKKICPQQLPSALKLHAKPALLPVAPTPATEMQSFEEDLEIRRNPARHHTQPLVPTLPVHRVSRSRFRRAMHGVDWVDRPVAAISLAACQLSSNASVGLGEPYKLARTTEQNRRLTAAHAASLAPSPSNTNLGVQKEKSRTSTAVRRFRTQAKASYMERARPQTISSEGPSFEFDRRPMAPLRGHLLGTRVTSISARRMQPKRLQTPRISARRPTHWDPRHSTSLTASEAAVAAMASNLNLVGSSLKLAKCATAAKPEHSGLQVTEAVVLASVDAPNLVSTRKRNGRVVARVSLRAPAKNLSQHTTGAFPDNR